MKLLNYVLILMVLASQNILAQETEMKMNHEQHQIHENHNGHLFSTAPIGVMGDHMHHKGSVMFSYRYMLMGMNSNLSGNSTVSNSDIFNTYMSAPQSMNMQMHMIGAMYAISDRFTAMVMANYISNTMDLKMKMGADFHTHSTGLGDLALSGMFKVINDDKNYIHTILGVSLPTATIQNMHLMPSGMNMKVAYPMQLGSGTYDPFVGGTYNGEKGKFVWGTQGIYKFRINRNTEAYKLGNTINTTIWGVYKTNDKINFSVRTKYENIEATTGVDADFNPMMMPLFNTNNSGKEELDVFAGFNYFVTNGTLKGIKIGVEVGLPAYQNVNGTQMKRTFLGTIGLQYSL